MQKKIGKALVVGAGIGGIRSALDLAETGYQVTLIDRAPHIGGILAQLDYQFPSNHCGMCKMLPLVERDAGSQYCLRKGLFHENITILTSTEVSGLTGEPGNFSVRLRQTSRWVDPDLCVGCGVCETVCPVSIPDSFNGGLGTRKAIYLPVPHAIPNPFVIDLAACSHCGACEAVCPTQAIRLADDHRKAFRILVVDDELAVRDSLKEWLVTEGFAAVDMAASGQQALEMLNETPYQLMLTDIKMPGMDGVELLKLAKESYPELTVVMMTAYATVETAVEAMKIGALDYFMKPFDPQAMIPLVVRIYEQTEASRDREITVHAVVVSTGTGYFDPRDGINPFGFGKIPHVVTSLQFERILSGGGPSGGRLLRPADGKPVAKVAWMQCVGSRDIQSGADFCSTICCMYAIKEAMLVKEKSKGEADTAIYYMDMRTGGKSFQRYRDKAAEEKGVRFERARVHSISPDPKSGDPVIRAMRMDGTILEEIVDMVVLAVGQRPSPGTSEFARTLDIEVNAWGFPQPQPFAPTRSTRPGIFLSGSASGLKDISESVIQASAAAMEAGRGIHAAGGSLLPSETPAPMPETLLQAPPKTVVVLCQCGDRLKNIATPEQIASRLKRDPAVNKVVFAERLCTAEGWEQLQALYTEHKPNRLLIGACHPYLFISKLKQLATETGLPARFMDVVDLQLYGLPADTGKSEAGTTDPLPANEQQILSKLGMALAGLKRAEPAALPDLPVTQRALVVGGGAAGMQAALSIADMGFNVDLVEKSGRLGGNLQWLHQTLDGQAVPPLLETMTAAVDKHPLVQVALNTRVVGAFGRVGHFHTSLETRPPSEDVTAESTAKTARSETYGAVVLATGGGKRTPINTGWAATRASSPENPGAENPSRRYRRPVAEHGDHDPVRGVPGRTAQLLQPGLLPHLAEARPAPENGQPGPDGFHPLPRHHDHRF